MHEIGHAARDIAKAKIGEYQPDSFGAPAWAPLKESTLREKKSKGYAIPYPLLRTGAMRDSISYTTSETSTQAILDLKANVPYASYHEEGTKRMARRAFMEPAVAEAIEDMRDELTEYIELAVLGFFDYEFVRAEAKLKESSARARRKRP